MATDYRPFVWFRGNCRDAFTRYTEILGGDLALLTFADAPSEEPVPPDRADLIIHASLTTEGAYVMGSDDPTGEFTRIQGMSVSVSVDGPDEARRVFDALADGGQVTAPVAETFFSPAFGMCVDRFGVPWMIVAATPDHPLGSEAPAIDALGAPPIG
jgi:PhnB protein